MKYKVAFDTTLFVEASLAEVAKTLLEAIALVVVVIFIFLQDWRTTLIPVITIPLTLIGTFAFVKVFGFSINTLTMFGLTLATGLVVDDAIIVVENVSRLIEDENLSPTKAASKSMQELYGALIAVSLVLMAVFVPVAFFPGSTGKIYQQFALTIAFSIAISTFLALTLTPALSALLLRPGQKPRGLLGKIFNVVNIFIDLLRRGYRQTLLWLTKIKILVILMFIASLGLTAWFYLHVPGGFLPEEDQGYFITIIQGPEGSSLKYTSKVMSRVEKKILEIPEINGTFAIGGFGFSGNTANSAVIFSTLKPWDERKRPDQSVFGIIGKLRGELSAITEARVIPVNPPAITGLGSFGGFQFELQDSLGTNSLNNMLQIVGQFMQRGNKTPGLQAVFSTFTANAPQIIIEVDRNKAKALQIPIDSIFKTLQTYLGSQYVNDFNFLSRTYRVYVQADAKFRSNPNDIGLLNVRSDTNQMIPLSSVIKMKQTTGAQTITHYNLLRSIEINGSAAPGYSSGQATTIMEKLAHEILPTSMSYEWSGVVAEEKQSGGLAPLIFGLGLVFVFLVLAAQYENYVDPLIIMLAVPLAILGALLAQSLRGLNNDVYCQVGLVMLIGLASKNAILIVEFANQLQEQGLSLSKAAVEAAQERLRPIIMTSLAFILGLWPLVVADGAGAASRQSLGTAVAGGMIVSTILSLFVVPILYIVIGTIRQRWSGVHQSQKH
jgi:HAE1 family hydrophobic/amphiphilic exporter-1